VPIIRRELAETRAQLRPRNPWDADWFAQAICVHSREGGWNSIGYVHGVPTYGGGMQFLISTWRSVGGHERSIYEIAASPPREQLYRAWLVWRRDGGRWAEWGTAGACGLS
jgi:hypothetical protein